jgi:rare lipoprotein A
VGIGALWAAGADPAFSETACGEAAWFDAGGRTASGEANIAGALTAAHRSLPFGAKVQVVNKDNGESVIVRINDRGAFDPRRILYVSKEAAKRLGFIHAGVAEVELTIIEGADPGALEPCGELKQVDSGVDVDQSDQPAPVAIPDGLAGRFSTAFQGESWAEFELRKAVEALLPARAGQ